MAKRDRTAERFALFHKNNPEVYDLFKRFAWEAKAAGYLRFSAKAIFYRMRWEGAVAQRGKGLKLNDVYTRSYAVLLMADDPRFAGFFEMRRPVAVKPKAEGE